MKINKVHLLFEQSGTFKRAFLALGIPAFDYDILDDFGETDYKIDLFAEIESAFDDKPSVFDSFSSDDLIFAFFPCVRFENQIMLFFRGQANQQKDYSIEQKMLYDMQLMDELSHFYKLVNKMFIVCARRGFRLIMENPYSKEHFLQRYWCLQPAIIDKDRRDNGDYFAKPTQYWFLNCTPEQNVLFEPLPDNAITALLKDQKDNWASFKGVDYLETGAADRKTGRSMIAPDYADRFIRTYILDGGNNGLSMF